MKNLILNANLCTNVFADYKFYAASAIAFVIAIGITLIKNKLIKAAAKRSEKKQK